MLVLQLDPSTINTTVDPSNLNNISGSMALTASEDTVEGSLSEQRFLNSTLACDASLVPTAPLDTRVDPEEMCQTADDAVRTPAPPPARCIVPERCLPVLMCPCRCAAPILRNLTSRCHSVIVPLSARRVKVAKLKLVCFDAPNKPAANGVHHGLVVLRHHIMNLPGLLCLLRSVALTATNTSRALGTTSSSLDTRQVNLMLTLSILPIWHPAICHWLSLTGKRCVQGASYRGTVNTSINGYTCQAWDSLTPNFHTRRPSAFPSSGLVSNYCRNPDNSDQGVWCFTTGQGPRWEKCDVPFCTDSQEASAVPAAVPGGKSEWGADGWRLWVGALPLLVVTTCCPLLWLVYGACSSIFVVGQGWRKPGVACHRNACRLCGATCFGVYFGNSISVVSISCRHVSTDAASFRFLPWACWQLSLTGDLCVVTPCSLGFLSFLLLSVTERLLLVTVNVSSPPVRMWSLG